MTRGGDKGKKLEPTLSRAGSRKDPPGPGKRKGRRRRTLHKKVVPISLEKYQPLKKPVGFYGQLTRNQFQG